MRCFRESILAHERKVIALVAKVNSRCFLWYPAAILVYHGGTPIWRLHTELYKFPWSVSANNSRTLYRTDLRLGEVVYLLIFGNIWNSWLLLLNGFEFIFVWRDSATRQFTCNAISIGKMSKWHKSTRAVKRSTKLSNGCKFEGCNGAKFFLNDNWKTLY